MAHWKFFFTLLIGATATTTSQAQQPVALNAGTVTALASEFDSLLTLGDPVGLDDILATDFYREIVIEGQVTPVRQSRPVFLASITRSLSESDVSLGHKRSPFSIRFTPDGDEAQVEYTVTDRAVTPEGTGYIANVETFMRAGIRQGQLRILSIRNQTRYKNKE